jgi:hypothetical protein
MAMSVSVITTSRQFHVPQVTDHQRVIVAEAIKQGVTQAGGAATIFQSDLLSPSLPLRLSSNAALTPHLESLG